jgi:hypothetical protein
MPLSAVRAIALNCLPVRNALHYRRSAEENQMASPAERMKMMRRRRRGLDLRELRLVVPDARSANVRQQVACEVSRLRRDSELEALTWIESVSEFDADAAG